jgi:hypothetical protein
MQLGAVYSEVFLARKSPLQGGGPFHLLPLQIPLIDFSQCDYFLDAIAL